MTSEQQRQLEKAILSDTSLEEVVALLRRYKSQGVPQGEVYSFLETLRGHATDEGVEDRILEVSDFVAGFCSPHMRIWEA